MSTFTVREWVSGHQRVVTRITTSGTASVNPTNTSVFASVREWNRNGDYGFVGGARMYVCNVAAGAGYVDVWVQVDWDSDLEFEITLFITTD